MTNAMTEAQIYISMMTDYMRRNGIKEAKKMLYSLTDITTHEKDVIWEHLMGDRKYEFR